MTLLYKLLGVLALIAALFFAVNWYNGHQQGIGYQKAVAEYNVKLIAAQTKAAEDTERLTKEKDDAIAQRIETEKKLAESKHAAAVASGGLRDTITDLRGQLSSATVEACRATADAGLRLLGACQERYIGVAAAAKGHQSDVIMFDQAWPK